MYKFLIKVKVTVGLPSHLTTIQTSGPITKLGMKNMNVFSNDHIYTPNEYGHS